MSLEVDAGDLALILCETHSCWALACRHAQHHARGIMTLCCRLCEIRLNWAVKMREVLWTSTTYRLTFDSAPSGP